MPYTPYSIDLGTVTPPGGAYLVQPQQHMAEIFILGMPANVTFELAFGTQDFFTVYGPITMEPDGEDLTNMGLRYRNLSAQPGSVVQITVVFGGTRLALTLA